MTAWWEVAAQRFEKPEPRWATPALLAKYFDPRTRITPAVGLIADKLVELAGTPNGRLIISMPPQEGKSTLAARWFPLWQLTQNKDTRIVVASYAHSLAMKHSEFARNQVTMFSSDLGFSLAADTAAKAEWRVEDHEGGMYAVGVGGALTGRPVDLMIIDDPLADMKQADSVTFRENVWEWYTATARTRLAPGAPMVLIQTRWHEDDLAGLLSAQMDEPWEVLSIPAQCEDPATDPLNRELGEFMLSARGRTQQEWEVLKAAQPARTWAALYQQRPAPMEGAIWQTPWIDNARRPLGDRLHDLVRIAVGVDPAAKSKTTSDMTGIIVAGVDRRGEVWVLADETVRGTPKEWASRVWSAVIEWNAGEVIVEDNQGGEMVTEVLQTVWRDTFYKQTGSLAPKVTTVTARESKRTRAESIAALYEVGKVHHASEDPKRLAALERQMVGWNGTGASPDRVDALGHVVTALLRDVSSTVTESRLAHQVRARNRRLR